MMTSDVEAPVVFVCESCSTRILVDRGVRNSLLEEGDCLICGAAVTEANFERR